MSTQKHSLQIKREKRRDRQYKRKVISILDLFEVLTDMD